MSEAETEADEPTDILTIAYQLGYQEGKKFRPSPSRKPMAEAEIPYHGSHYYRAFLAGVRFAEKHHFGIGGDGNG